ncbi:hypothetical protein [Burkholderia cepacia]|uniref:Lipoprotein n=1 Tax=Burkholderia cepacia GG4 TaxID=1009846 RepID=A0A9W3K449_BURCE|nr:hypothetical protein [Burkholderia cepacia]AFQ50413.1 putative lipoprotein [Burkholderia cepacia GG4]
MGAKKVLSAQQTRETAVGLAGFALGLSFACLVVHMPGGSGEWASWAQAIGTVGAVIGAIWAAYHQTDHARKSAEKHERESDTRAYGLLQSIVLRLYSNTQSLASHLAKAQKQEDLSRRQRRRDEFDQLHTAIAELPVHVFPDFRSVTCLLDARQLSDEVLALAQDYASKEGMFSGIEKKEDPAPWQSFQERAMLIFEELSDGIKRIRLGVPEIE